MRQDRGVPSAMRLFTMMRHAESNDESFCVRLRDVPPLLLRSIPSRSFDHLCQAHHERHTENDDSFGCRYHFTTTFPATQVFTRTGLAFRT